MQTQNHTQATSPRDLDIWTTQGKLETKYLAKRDERDDTRGTVELRRVGPLPGEVYPDEAHFGSFS